jgi:thiosulfate dehydrogenase [quinone] large subunit
MADQASAKEIAAPSATWRWAGLSLLSARFIQGFIYWGGGSRRFIYAPAKLVPHGHWMANKFQSAMPGALLGTDKVIAYMLHHFEVLYPALIVFSGLELLCGLGLIAGFLTRLSALGSIGFSIALMLMFGWQGATCIDEWTMAACNLAIGATVVLMGGGAYSLDNLLLRRWPGLAQRSWFRWVCGSLPLPMSNRSFERTALLVFAATIAFNVATYNYYRGSVVTPFHEGPVNPSKHHYTLTNAVLTPRGLDFHAYLDGGTPEAMSRIVQAKLTGPDGRAVETWSMSDLSRLPKSAIHNDFAYNQIKTGPYGLVSEIGAEATIALPVTATAIPPGPLTLTITNISGRSFNAAVRRG